MPRAKAPEAVLKRSTTPTLLTRPEGFAPSKKPRLSTKHTDPLASFESSFGATTADSLNKPRSKPHSAIGPSRPGPVSPSKPHSTGSSSKHIQTTPRFVLSSSKGKGREKTPAARPLARRVPPIPLVQSSSPNKPPSTGPRPAPIFHLSTEPHKPLKPLHPPNLRPETPPPRAQALKTPSTTVLARATDLRTDSGAARFLALALAGRGGTGYVSPAAQALFRGLASSPTKSASHTRQLSETGTSLAARFRTLASRTDGATQLWRAARTHRSGLTSSSAPLRLCVLRLEAAVHAPTPAGSETSVAHALLVRARVEARSDGGKTGFDSDNDDNDDDAFDTSASAGTGVDWRVRRGARMLLVLPLVGAELDASPERLVVPGARVDVWRPWSTLALGSRVPEEEGDEGDEPMQRRALERKLTMEEFPLPSPLGSAPHPVTQEPGRAEEPLPRTAVLCRRFVVRVE